MLKTSKISGISDIEALERKPWREVCPAASTYDLLAAAAEERGDAPAITFLLTGALNEEPIRLSFKRFFERINQTANLLTDLGVGPTDVVSFLLPLLPQTQYVLWGAEAAGIVNPINFLLRPEQIADLMNAAQTKVVVAMGPNPALEIWNKVMSIKEQVPSLTAVLSVFGPDDPASGIYSLDQRIDQYPADRLVSHRNIAPNDIAAYFHTGGTTGSPKLARQTHNNQVYAAWTIANMWDYSPQDRGISGLPLFHVAGAFVLSLAPLAAGMEIVIPTPAGLRNPEVIKNHWRLVEKYQPSLVGGVPTSIGALLNVPVDGADISSVKCTLTGGSALPVQVEKDFRRKFGLTVYQMYGQTEATVVIAMNPVHREPAIGSVGLRVPYQEWKVARLVPHGVPTESCAPGETGVLMIKGPNVFAGYLDQLQNEGTLTADGWLITGDLGYLDDSGQLYLTGRAKELIIRSAHNIDPATIEEALVEHPAVELAAAVGRPDTYAGELPVAYVQLRPGSSATPEELLEFVTQRISEPPAKPKEVVIISQMPMTGVGKVFKPQLRWDQAGRVFSEALRPLAKQGLKIQVQVAEDKVHGTLATVMIMGAAETDRAELERDVAEILNRFTYIKHTVRWS